MILRAEYTALAEAATAVGFDIAAGVALPHGGPTLPLVVEVPPLRIAPLVAAYPPGRWLLMGEDEALTDYAARVWPVLEPIQQAALRAGIVPLVFPTDECQGQVAGGVWLAAEIVRRMVAIRDVVLALAQGSPPADAVGWALHAAATEPTDMAEAVL